MFQHHCPIFKAVFGAPDRTHLADLSRIGRYKQGLIHARI